MARSHQIVAFDHAGVSQEHERWEAPLEAVVAEAIPSEGSVATESLPLASAARRFFDDSSCPLSATLRAR